MRPNRLIVRAFLFRGARVWLAMRGILGMVLLRLEQDPLRIDPAAAVALVLVSVAVGFVQAWRQQERALLLNLAVPPATIGVLLATVPVLGEVAVAFAAASWT